MVKDILVKNNIIKADKAIIDIGIYSAKILEAHYTAKCVDIEDANIIKTGFKGEFDFEEFAKRVDTVLVGKVRKDIIVSLPSSMAESKIISIKNKTDKDTKSLVEKQCQSFGKASNITHVINSTFLGKREEQGDSVSYFLISAVSKAVINELIESFEDQGMKITRIVCSQYNQVCLSNLYNSEYDSLNRIVFDMGHKESRITAFAEGVAVYTRVINYGFNDYVEKIFKVHTDAGKRDIQKALINIGGDNKLLERDGIAFFENINKNLYLKCISDVDDEILNEISRILDMCNNNDIDISKIFCTGSHIIGFSEKLEEASGIPCENVYFTYEDEISGENFVVIIDTENIEPTFSGAVGLAACPMF